jgi:hypothetical protein
MRDVPTSATDGFCVRAAAAPNFGTIAAGGDEAASWHDLDRAADAQLGDLIADHGRPN